MHCCLLSGGCSSFLGLLPPPRLPGPCKWGAGWLGKLSKEMGNSLGKEMLLENYSHARWNLRSCNFVCFLPSQLFAFEVRDGCIFVQVQLWLVDHGLFLRQEKNPSEEIPIVICYPSGEFKYTESCSDMQIQAPHMQRDGAQDPRASG